jgi:hypothetical protein
MKHEPIINYDELFCTTLKEDKILVYKDIKELLQRFIKAYPNDKQLGKEIRRKYGSSEGK